MPDGKPQLSPGRLIVVLDVNIYLDVARELGEPFTWAKFDAALQNGACDSVQAVALLRAGKLPDGRLVEVWTSDHIDRLVAMKAEQPVDAVDERDRGLGWTRTGAQGLIDTLITDMLEGTNGGTAGNIQISYGTPPLDHEDGCVYGTVRDAGSGDDYEERYCLTRDGHFRWAKLPGLIDVRYPDEWVIKHKAMARAEAFKKMLGGGAALDRASTCAGTGSPSMLRNDFDSH